MKRKNHKHTKGFVALLRGVNVGGKNRLAMKELIELVTSTGAENVRTYIQSGNVVFQATPELAERMPTMISNGLAELGLKVPVVMRSSDDLSAVVTGNSFLDAGGDFERLYVAFLADKPAQQRAAKLDHDRSPPDAFKLSGRDIYLHCPNGLARTKLTTSYFDSTLNTTSTIRNWKTVAKLCDWCAPKER